MEYSSLNGLGHDHSPCTIPTSEELVTGSLNTTPSAIYNGPSRCEHNDCSPCTASTIKAKLVTGSILCTTSTINATLVTGSLKAQSAIKITMKAYLSTYYQSENITDNEKFIIF